MPLPLPEVTPETEAFWTGGAAGELRIMACRDCDLRIHPPQLVCPRCGGHNVAPVTASGRGTIVSYTINHQAWLPDLEVPYALAIVDLEDQPGVRMTARVATRDLEALAIGQAVTVAFEARGPVHVPYFEPS